jgi:hypothetical protein
MEAETVHLFCGYRPDTMKFYNRPSLDEGFTCASQYDEIPIVLPMIGRKFREKLVAEAACRRGQSGLR